MFKGTYRHQLDSKGRLAVPFKFRAQLPDGGTVARWAEGAVGIWPTDAWNELTARLRAHPVDDESSRALLRHLFASADDITFDSQGRCQIPPELRVRAGLSLDSQVLIIGVDDHAEIWTPDAWAAYEDGSPSIEQLLRRSSSHSQSS